MLGGHLRTARLRARWSQDRLADEVGVSRSAIAMYESGQRLVPHDVLVAAAKALRAPELLLQATMHPLTGLVMRTDLQVAIGWLREELNEALQAVERQEEACRKGRRDDRLDEQVLDIATALCSYLLARAREGLDLEGLQRRQQRKVLDRYGTPIAGRVA